MWKNEGVFMQQSECGVEWTFPLSEEQQLAIYCQNFNVFMASHYFDRILFWHYMV
uniref:Uncharacterized protein n=1 Tax=Anguilla anguilla TaxID=7936 RepID=A0A0E9XLW6_ANGAN